MACFCLFHGIMLSPSLPATSSSSSYNFVASDNAIGVMIDSTPGSFTCFWISQLGVKEHRGD